MGLSGLETCMRGNVTQPSLPSFGHTPPVSKETLGMSDKPFPCF